MTAKDSKAAKGSKSPPAPLHVRQARATANAARLSAQTMAERIKSGEYPTKEVAETAGAFIASVASWN